MLDLAASFQSTVVGILVQSLKKATSNFNPRSILLSGGVAANNELRAAVRAFCDDHGLEAFIPAPRLTTDNAAMIAAAGYDHFRRHETSDASFNADASLQLAKKPMKKIGSHR
jgi:N6-L-threonylcarbamoyladenine synthase